MIFSVSYFSHVSSNNKKKNLQRYNWNVVESGVKQPQSNQTTEINCILECDTVCIAKFVFINNISSVGPIYSSVRLYLQLFVGGCMSYLRYFCLFAYSGVQHILCCVFVSFFFILCTLCCQILWIVLFWLPLRYSLTFIP